MCNNTLIENTKLTNVIHSKFFIYIDLLSKYDHITHVHLLGKKFLVASWNSIIITSNFPVFLLKLTLPQGIQTDSSHLFIIVLFIFFNDTNSGTIVGTLKISVTERFFLHGWFLPW